MGSGRIILGALGGAGQGDDEARSEARAQSGYTNLLLERAYLTANASSNGSVALYAATRGEKIGAPPPPPLFGGGGEKTIMLALRDGRAVGRLGEFGLGWCGEWG